MEQPLVWVGTSWKMNKTLTEAQAFVDGISSLRPMVGVQPFVLPAHTALAAVREWLPADTPVMIGAQNAHWGPEGAGTGEVSMRMVKDAGARLVEIGHSERRAAFCETDATVAAKTAAALAQDLIPLVCVGEPLAVRRAGEAEGFVAAQVRAALSDVATGQIGEVLLAYEPVWAIGAGGRPATPDEIAPVMAAIAAAARDLGGGTPPRALLYGGGVDEGNAAAILSDPHVHGLFVGRAGWGAAGYLRLIEIAARHAAQLDGTGSHLT